MTNSHPVAVTVSLVLLTTIVVRHACANEGVIGARDDNERQQQRHQHGPGDESEEFAHLLNVANGYGERVHIISEIVQDGASVQVEEFLDLASMNQLIQFKWHDYSGREAAPGGQKRLNRKMLKTRKLNVVILNNLGKGKRKSDEDRSLLYQYEPYKCDMSVLDKTDATDKASDWHSFKLRTQDKVEDLPSEKIYANLINSLKSTAPNSPYLTRIVTTATKSKTSSRGNSTTAQTTTSWLLGVAGLWAKAQYNDQLVGRLSMGPSGLFAWRLEVAGQFLVDYYMEEAPVSTGTGNSDNKPIDGQASDWYRASYRAPSMIEIASVTGPVVDSAIQLINVFQVDFQFSDRLARNLFKLPLGFDCPVQPMTGRGIGSVYIRDQVSQLIRLEVVLNRFEDEPEPEPELGSGSDSEGKADSLYSVTEIKNVQLARVRHPLNSNSRLVMVQSDENRYKLVLDYHYNLEYHVLSNGPGPKCAIRHLSKRVSSPHGKKESAPASASVSSSSNIIYFSGGFLFDMNEFHLNYILGQRDDISTGSGAPPTEDAVNLGRLLNVFAVSERENELIYEANVTEAHGQMLMPMDHEQRRMTIVRVYKQELGPKRSMLDGSVRLVAKGALELKRVMILVFNLERSKRLAELRLNIVGDSHQMLTLAKRAKLFDLSQCFDKSEQTMQVTATYPADPRLLDYIRDNSHELLEYFYRQASNCRTLGNFLPTMTTGSADDGGQRRQLDEATRDRQRLGMSLNYLRVPRAELLGSPGGDIELRLTVLDKVAPIELFGRVKQATFSVSSSSSLSLSPTDDDSFGATTLLLEDVSECSRYCQLFECKTFAFDFSGECKLSRLPLLGMDNSTRAAATGSSRSKATTASVHLTLKTSSQVYFEPEFMQDSSRFAGEASLAELSSYIEHYSDELSTYFELANRRDKVDGSKENEEEDDGDDDASGGASFGSSRVKRYLNAANWPEANKPVFAFNFADKSNLVSEYAPPSYRLLVPSELSGTRAPPVFNVGEARQMQQMARTFSTKWHFKEFNLTALDGAQGEMAAASYGLALKQLAGKNERVFRNKAEQSCYTLRQMFAMNQDNCALVCHNIDERNSARSGGQVCVGFSYSALERRCALAIKTDFNFVANMLDLADEGDRVLEVESLEQLLGDSQDGLVALRNYLSQYESPIKLVGANFHGEPTTSGREFESLELEWLQAIATETSQNQAGEVREKCALACNDRNRRGKLCLAFDFCTLDKPSLSPEDRSAVQYGTTCELLFVTDTGRRNGRGRRIGELRTYLTQATRSKSGQDTDGETTKESKSNGSKEEAVVGASKCSRYLLSHMYDFTHLSQRQLATVGDKDERQSQSSSFEKLTETEHELNVDKCALECSLRGAPCVLFEFCLRLPKQTDQPQQQAQKQQHDSQRQLLGTSCTLYTVSSSFAATDEAQKEPWRATSTESGDESNRPLSSYNRHCHIYLRNQYDSLDSALAYSGSGGRGGDTSDDDYSTGGMSGKFTHSTLSVGFVAAYLVVVVCILLYVARGMRLCATISQQELTPIVEIQLNERSNR